MSTESLDITLGRIVYHNVSQRNRAGVKYLIARTSSGVTVKGEMSKAIEGERYRLFGEWRLQKPYKGRPAEEAFEFSHHEVIIDQSESGISHYLRTHVDGVGITRAQALVAEFGADTLTILRTEPERAAVVKGITPEIIESIKRHFAESVTIDPAAYAKLIDMFSGYKVPKKIINTLLKDFGSNAPQAVSDNPYMLLAFPRLGWQIVDAFATATAGYPADGIERHKAAIVEALERIHSQGHTYGTAVDIEAIAFGLINAKPRQEAWLSSINDNLVAVNGVDQTAAISYSLPKIALAETTIAERLVTLAALANPLPFTLDDTGLNEGQRNALRLIEQYGVVIISGAPGVGKSYTLSRALAGVVKEGFTSIRYVAPTGKAAKRAAELLQGALPGCPIEPSTIHKALGPEPSKAPEGVPQAEAKMGRGREEFGFRHGIDNPIEASIIVVDECFPPGTMIDTPDGYIDISKINPGQKIFNAIGIDSVIAVSSKEIHRAVNIKVGSQEIIVSENHPFFTRRGEVFAGDLKPGDSIVKTIAAMRLLRDFNRQSFTCGSAVLQSCLQRALVDEYPGILREGEWEGVEGKGWEGEKRLAKVGASQGAGRDEANRGTQPNVQAGSPREAFSSSQGNRAQAPYSGRERAGIDGAPAKIDGSPRDGMGGGIRSEVGSGQGWLSDELQGRSCQPGNDDCNRSGREFASITEGAGREEGCQTGFARVDSVEVLESGDPRLDRFRDASGKLYFYDLQAARHRSFSVSGLLVHNCSMVDVKLGASLVNAVANGSRLIIVGDPNQLPSVGAGSVLRDLIAAGVPTATLTEVQRNSGRIVRACHAILGGSAPDPSPKVDLPNGENWVHLEIPDPMQIAQQVVKLHESAKRNGNYDPEWDMQVISPEKRKPGVGCNYLNKLLADLLNPYRKMDPAKVESDDMGAPVPFERGDKVIRTKNGLCDRMVNAAECDGDSPLFRWDGRRYGLIETDIVNGDMGTVLDIVQEGDNWYVVVQFRTPDRLCRLPYGECHLELAYAVTCHKSQGSGFKYVIVPVHDSFYFNTRTGEGLWNREMIYTLLSRAETLLVTVGSAQAIRSAVGRPTVQRRKTRLAQLMRARLAVAGVDAETVEDMACVEA